MQAQALSLTSFTVNRPFRDRIEVRVARRPALVRRDGQMRDLQMGIGPQAGNAGDVKTLSITPRTLFRGEKLIAMDDATPPGSGTVIKSMFVGAKNQFLNVPGAGGGIPSLAFAPNSLSPGIKMDVCQPSLSISLEIEFLKTCTFTAALFGRGSLFGKSVT